MPYEVPPLPYDYSALEPHIDEQTMRLHHDKHHQAYVDNANKALDGHRVGGPPRRGGARRTWRSCRRRSEPPSATTPAATRTTRLFWEIMSPDGGGEPSGPLADAINDTFDSVDELKKLVNDTGVKRFGSGWSWLVYDGTGLAVYSTANQDSPISNSDVPLLGIDVWEHAYYLKYQNRRPEYLETWWNVVNWDAVQKKLRERGQVVRALAP